MFPMTISVHNHNQLNAVMAALAGNPAAVEQIAETVSEAKPAKAPKKEAAKVETPVVAEVAQAEPEQKPETLAQMSAAEAVDALDGHANQTAEAPTYQATADAVTKLARAKGRDAAVAVLSKFGAAKLPEVKPEDFAAVIAECEVAGA